jgi:hypothetical protein
MDTYKKEGVVMPQDDTYAGPERRGRDRSQGIQLRRRKQEWVENERRRTNLGGFDIAAVLEMHLDQCRTRRAMLELLDGWLMEAKNAPQESQDPNYIGAVERSIEIMKNAPDLETAIAILQRA